MTDSGVDGSLQSIRHPDQQRHSQPPGRGGWAYNILDDDTNPAVSLQDGTVDESSGVASLVVALSAPHSVGRPQHPNTGRQRQQQSDYQPTTQTVTIPRQLSTTVAITIENDLLDENDEQFVAIITSAAIEDSEARITIRDDDSPPSLSVQPTSASESDAVLIIGLRSTQPANAMLQGE